MPLIDRQCECCRKPFKAKAADIKRGWGRFCSKRCKAIKQEAQTGAYHRHLNNADIDDDPSWDAHKT